MQLSVRVIPIKSLYGNKFCFAHLENQNRARKYIINRKREKERERVTSSVIPNTCWLKIVGLARCTFYAYVLQIHNYHRLNALILTFGSDSCLRPGLFSIEIYTKYILQHIQEAHSHRHPVYTMADLEAVLADVSYLMAMEKSKCTPAARASKKIILPDPRWVSILSIWHFILIFDTI